MNALQQTQINGLFITDTSLTIKRVRFFLVVVVVAIVSYLVRFIFRPISNSRFVWFRLAIGYTYHLSRDLESTLCMDIHSFNHLLTLMFYSFEKKNHVIQRSLRFNRLFHFFRACRTMRKKTIVENLTDSAVCRGHPLPLFFICSVLAKLVSGLLQMNYFII